MSYLSSRLRLHFAGKFQASVSTVNNDVKHFNNTTFKPSYQDRQDGAHMNGWWNPDGDGVWRLLGCDITAAYNADGTSPAANDRIYNCSIADSDDSVPAKIVDLDPEQQMVSTIFGLQVRIADGQGNTLMRGYFAPSAFTELWMKIVGGGGDLSMGAMWQSVVTVTEWGDLSNSPFLQSLKAEADANSSLLSMKFNVDCYSMTWPTTEASAEVPPGSQFCRGRIVGTLGPASPNEPRHFVFGRQLMAPQPAASNLTPYINYCAAVVDQGSSVVRVDLGNALQINADGSQVDNGTLTLSVIQNGSAVELGTIPYTQPGWYQATAGIVEIPVTSDQLAILADNPLSLVLSNYPTAPTAEPTGGLYVRADLFVFRMSPGDAQPVTFYASAYGQPYTGQSVTFDYDSDGLQVSPGDPQVATPTSALTFPAGITTDATTGKATLTLTAADPGNPRGYIDGQIYGVGYGLANQGADYPSNIWNFVSVLVYDSFVPDSPVTWYGSMQPIFQQYANLYPVMARFVDLGDYLQVVSYTRMLQLAFSLPEDDPNAMPVTRDLSPAKRKAILEWLQNPLEGTPPKSPTVLAAAAPPAPADNALSKGGKAAAFTKRLALQKP
ncbi:MAG: hypothetical protein QM755_07360 [Luteolibacter sp.]